MPHNLITLMSAAVLNHTRPAECTAQSVLQKGKPRTALRFIIPIGYELLHLLAGMRKGLLGLSLVAAPAACWHVIGSCERVGGELFLSS